MLGRVGTEDSSCRSAGSCVPGPEGTDRPRSRANKGCWTQEEGTGDGLTGRWAAAGVDPEGTEDQALVAALLVLDPVSMWGRPA